MKISKIHFALLVTLACIIGMYFGYRMGVKMKNGDNRVLYPVSSEETPAIVDSALSED